MIRFLALVVALLIIIIIGCIGKKCLEESDDIIDIFLVFIFTIVVLSLWCTLVSDVISIIN